MTVPDQIGVRSVLQSGMLRRYMKNELDTKPVQAAVASLALAKAQYHHVCRTAYQTSDTRDF